MPRDGATDNDVHDPVAEMVELFNKQYMVVNEAGKAVVYESAFDSMLKRKHFVRLEFNDLRKLHMNRQICVGVDGKKRPIMQSKAAVWLAHPDRREYIGGVVFDPSCSHVPDNALNLWQGYEVTARRGSWARMQDHILNVICDGHKDYFDYLMCWMARLVQFPAQQGEVAVVMRGGEGTGKGTLAKALLHILGQHGLAISNVKHLTGNFNAHLRDCALLFADEAFFAGDRAHIGALKSLITEPYLTIEAKYKNAVQMPNFVHLMMASNEQWVIPAACDARRFFVLEVSSKHANDHAYFAAILEELDNGGYEAMLHDLLTCDLTFFNVRNVPETEGLRIQRKLSLGTSEAWWMDALHRGYVYRSELGLEDHFSKWHDEVSTEVLFASYESYARERHERHPMSREAFGSFMRDIAGAKWKRLSNAVTGEHLADVDNIHGGTARKSQLIKQKRPPGFELGALNDAQAAFDRLTGLDGHWTS
jgi:uncharacterized protein DUF5906